MLPCRNGHQPIRAHAKLAEDGGGRGREGEEGGRQIKIERKKVRDESEETQEEDVN